MMEPENNCTFCRIFNGELPVSWVDETGEVVAFLDLHPINPGHTLVVPRRHVCSFTDLSPAETEWLAKGGQRIASLLKAKLPDCEGVSMVLADGEVAGQEVPHVHLHVIPRRPNDGFSWRFPIGYGPAAERTVLDEMADRLRSALDQESDK